MFICPTSQAPSASWLLPILPLIIAALAVFFGPLVTLRISRRQFRLAEKQIIAPMRQAWINNLREKLAEVTASASHYFNKEWSEIPEEKRGEEEKRLTQVEKEIELLINPSEIDHKELVDKVREMRSALERGMDRSDEFWAARDRIIVLGQKIFKTEWNRIKEGR